MALLPTQLVVLCRKTKVKFAVMSRKTRTYTLSAILSALTVVFLYISSIWPTGQLGLVAISSLFTVAAIVEAGLIPGVYVYVVSSVLGMLLVPNKASPLLYMLFFGYYPILKSVIERIRAVALQWVLKLLVFNAALSLIWFIMIWLALDFYILFADYAPDLLILFLGGNAVFALFDYGFSKLIRLYMNRVTRRAQ